MVNISADIAHYFLNEMNEMGNNIDHKKIVCYDKYVNLTNIAIEEAIWNQNANHSNQMNEAMFTILNEINYTNMLK